MRPANFNMRAHLLYYHKVKPEGIEGMTPAQLERVHDLVHGRTSSRDDKERAFKDRKYDYKRIRSRAEQHRESSRPHH